MVKILFVCHGNICRSPMAEFVLKDKVNRSGQWDHYVIESAATSSEELGNSVYPPAKRTLRSHGIGTTENELGVGEKHARRITDDDYEKFDLLIGMDEKNIRNLKKKYNGDPQGKIHSMMEFTDRPGNVADPWYTGDFEATWNDVNEGCDGLLKWLKMMKQPVWRG